MAEHRVPMLGTSWRRYEDPVNSRDPRVRELVGALAQLPSPEPRPEFRAELRAQLVAIAPRIVGETARTSVIPRDVAPAKKPAHGTRPQHTDSALARVRGLRFGRPLAVVASVITAFALLFGGAVWVSQKALPGDALYGLKRASESWQLATAGSPTDKARDYLKFAQTRVGEAKALAGRATGSAAGAGPQAGGLDAHTAGLITSTLASADHDVRAASALLGSQAVRSRSSSPLSVLASWAPGQLARLRDLASVLPDGAARNHARSSARLVSAAVNRAEQLAAALPTGCPSISNADELGPLPVTNCRAGAGTRPVQHPRPRQHPTNAPPTSHAGTNGVPTRSAPSPVGSHPPKPTGSPSPSSPPPIVTIPTLPAPTSLPVSVSSCGLGVTLGPIGIGVGVCPS